MGDDESIISQSCPKDYEVTQRFWLRRTALAVIKSPLEGSVCSKFLERTRGVFLTFQSRTAKRQTVLQNSLILIRTLNHIKRTIAKIATPMPIHCLVETLSFQASSPKNVPPSTFRMFTMG